MLESFKHSDPLDPAFSVVQMVFVGFSDVRFQCGEYVLGVEMSSR
jgi:hypothetical protein